MTTNEADSAPVPNGADESPVCASCGKDLWWCDLPPALDGNVWVCGECDAALNFDSLEDL